METIPRKIDHLCELVDIELLKPGISKNGNETVIEGLGLNGELVEIRLIGARIPEKVYSVTVRIEEA